MDIWIPNKVSINTYENCELSTTIPPKGLPISINNSTHVVCKKSLVPGFDTYEAKIQIEILDYTVTQQKVDIIIMYPIIQFTEVETNRSFVFDQGGVKTQASLAAILRGGLNPDPCGFYPIKGKGNYVDNVIQVENKEDTAALNVEFISIVPMISPVVDGSDQTEVIRTIQFYDQYYKKETNNFLSYPFPFRSLKPRDFDYMDMRFLNEKDIIFVAEWDIPVKIFKSIRNSSFPLISNSKAELDIGNLNFTSSIDNPDIILQQYFFSDSDIFFEHAAQRLMTFIDIHKEKGAKVYFNNSSVPENLRNPNSPLIAKKEYLFTRSDAYFYSSRAYQFPQNVDASHVFSIDRYPNSTKPCEPVFGNARAEKLVQGYFDDSKPNGLKAHEYSNELLMHCEKKKIEFNKSEGFTNGSVRPTHYIVQIKDPEVERPSDILGFNETTGEHLIYPELKMIYGHTLILLIPGNITRQGGKIETKLPSTCKFIGDPIKDDLLTYSADQIAFYKTTYDEASNTITSYFKRGLMPNEAYGKPSSISIMAEQFSIVTNFSVEVRIWEMKYDISAKELNYERYTLRETRTETFVRDKFFRLPALEIHIKLNRTGDTSMRSYELMEPFARYGVYIQELEKHRTVYGILESHHVSDPGIQSINAGFAMISNIGISPVPFAEYVTTGKAILIPSSPTTSRLEWNDIWGRHWSQPLRSIFPDIPPIPPPIRNFMMTTTFELTNPSTGARHLTWTSDENLDIRFHLKLLNNYPKYFQITTCKDNEVIFLAQDYSYSRLFDPPPYKNNITSLNFTDDAHHIKLAQISYYGNCFNTTGVILSGKAITEYQADLIGKAYLCAQKLNQTENLECVEKLQGIPTVSRRKDGTTITWNFSPKVLSYYPKEYIKDNMWDLTHYDYDDNAFDKSYKYHMDNNLPNVDRDQVKLHNVIAQPIFKGFGFEITYSQDNTLKRFPGYKGWWSDNLQNKDHTLLAGQDKSYNVSVDKGTLLPSSKWINVNNLTEQKVVSQKLKNLYVCMYNQHRIRMKVDNSIFAFPNNVNQNNIVPILPDLTTGDPRLSSFDCQGKFQYSPTNISLVNNIVLTPTIRDWLYFGANLRGNALETINIALKLKPFANVKYEGLAKVQDGGTFVYWNPCCGPNLYLIVNDPVNVIEAKRNDLDIEVEILPQLTTTFNSEIYQVISIRDPLEILREWKLDAYTNNFGFGDSVVAVYVGGVEGSRATVWPGQKTYAKITFYNNAGFDWNLKFSGIDFEYRGSAPINADDLMRGAKHSIQAPLKYNFMNLAVPSELSNYVQIIPSTHNIEVAPLFFDFQNINVATIRDGFKGDFFYEITLSKDVPPQLMGKVWEINITLNESYFDRLPGYNDPTKTGYHDYKLLIPSIKFGIPYPSYHMYAGKVFYTLGYSKNLSMEMRIPNNFDLDQMKMIDFQTLTKFRQAAGNPDTSKTEMNKVWASQGSAPTFSFSSQKADSTYNRILVNLTQKIDAFPIVNGTYPDIAEIFLILKQSAKQLTYGTTVTNYDPKIYFTDINNKTKMDQIPAPNYRSVSAKGAWIVVNYNGKVVIPNDQGELVVSPDQRIYPVDSGILQVYLRASNVGTGIAYGTNFSIYCQDNLKVLEKNFSETPIRYTISKNGTYTVINLSTKRDIVPGDSIGLYIYLEYEPYTVTSQTRILQAKPKSRNFIDKVVARIDLTQSLGETQVEQTIDADLTFDFVQTERDMVNLAGSYDGSKTAPTIRLAAVATPENTSSNFSVRYVFYRKLLVNYNNSSSFQPSWVEIRKADTDPTCVDSPIPSSFNGSIDQLLVEYKVETYSERKSFLAKNSWTYNSSKYIVWLIVLLSFAGLALLSVGVYFALKFFEIKIAISSNSQSSASPVRETHVEMKEL